MQPAAMSDPARIGERRAEIYTYESQNHVYSMNWSVRAPLTCDCRCRGAGLHSFLQRR